MRYECAECGAVTPGLLTHRKHIASHGRWVRREFTDACGARRTEWWCPQGRPDHYYSCELMQIACASARGLLSVPREVGPLFEHAAQN